MKYSGEKLVEHLASAYALGTLAVGTRRRFERLMQDRADIALAVGVWQAHLGRLAGPVPPASPPRRVWREIEARTRPSGVRADSRPFHWLVPAGLGLAGAVAGVVAAFALFWLAPAIFISADRAAMRTGERLPQSYVGLLVDDKGEGKLLVSSLRHGRTMTVKVIGPIQAPAQGRLVLWAVPGDAPPFVLGNVPATGSATTALPDTSEKLLSKVRKLAVTVETAPVPAMPGTPVFTGNCAKLW